VETRADKYRRLARECLRLVSTTSVSAGRSTLIEMARVWTQLADEQDEEQRQQFLAMKDAGETPVRPQVRLLTYPRKGIPAGQGFSFARL
jgi:hypothetical protein